MIRKLQFRSIVAFSFLCFLAISDSVFAENARAIQIRGYVETYTIDQLNGVHKVSIYLREQNSNRRYELLNAPPSKEFSNRQLVLVKGKQLNSSQISIEDIAYDGGTASAESAGLANAVGLQKTLVYLVNFQDYPTDMPWTLAQVEDVVFNQVNSFYLENSNGLTSITGTVIGWYTLPIDSTNCDGFAIQNYAQQIAVSRGVAINNYDRHVFVFPKNACGYSGMGQTGALPSSAWIHNSMNIRTIAHELGHNLGLNHSSAVKCPETPLNSSISTCTKQEYGNTLDIMGYSGTVGHFNSYQKHRLGWLDSQDIMTVTADGIYTLAPFAFSSSQTRALKIYRGIDSTTGLKEWFYLEYRQPLGFDSMITDRGVILASNVFNGVAIVLGTEGNGKNYLLDMTPGSNFVDMKDPALLSAAIFSDPLSKVSIETLSASSTGVSVRISLNGSSEPPADSSAPTISITSPSNNATVSNSITISTSASDNVGISKVELYIDGVLKQIDTSSPYGFSLDTKTLSDGAHTLLVRAFDAANNVGSSQISINVSNPKLDTTPPSVLITSPQNGAVFSPRTSLTIQANASDDIGVYRVEFYVNGLLICTDFSASYTCSYKLGGSKGVIYNLEARAYDQSGNMNKHQITINSSSEGTGGGKGGK